MLPARAVLALADRVRRWHEAQRPADVAARGRAGRRARAALGAARRRSGIYVPRGLVSTLVMCAVPGAGRGRRADRRRARRPQGAGLVAAAAELLGIDEVWALGGPQAIAWLAYVRARRQDRRARQRVRERGEARWSRATSRSTCPAGPSEVVVLAGRGADPRVVELELAAQAEHGPARLPHRRRDGDLEGARGGRGARARAPRAARRDAEALRRACGTPARSSSAASSPVAAGDYATGGNHVLPTGGWARSVGGLGLETFLKPVTIQRLTPEGLALLRPTVEALAAAEGMPAHAEAVRR